MPVVDLGLFAVLNRYAKEKRRTPLPGRRDGGFPTVRVADRYRDVLPDGTHIQASVVTRQDGEDGIPRPHWHRLEGREGEHESVLTFVDKARLPSSRFPRLGAVLPFSPFRSTR